MKNFSKNNRFNIKGVLSVVLGLCFVSLLLNISNPLLHAKLHELEDSHVFGHEDHHDDDHSSKDADHSNACHFCRVVSHFYSDIPAVQTYLTAIIVPQELALHIGDNIIVIALVRPDSTRAPPVLS